MMPDTAGNEYMPDGNKAEPNITAQARAVIRPPAAIFCVFLIISASAAAAQTV